MIELQLLLAVALVAGLLTLVPGIGTSLVLRGALTRGARHAFATSFGICTGAMLWGVAAVGASELLAASELAYRALTLAGAAYMIWLGASLIWESFRGHSGMPHSTAGPAAQPMFASTFRAWSMGVGTNLLNPKVGVFYLATIPQFAPDGTAPVMMGLALAAVHALLSFACFTVIIIATGFVARWLRSPKAVRIIDRITGVVLIGFGAKLAVSPA
ncbi:MAG: LysE family translocator [Microbacterium sp.]|uniref:LysE family translocator n=1 Tax=Microbacterium sp. TaxID=51671 RepID=UPI003D6F1172